MDEGDETDDPRVAWRGREETNGDKSKKPRRESESRAVQKESGRWEEEEEEEEERRGDAGREKKREEKGTRGQWKSVGNRGLTRVGREDQVFNPRRWIFCVFFPFFLFHPITSVPWKGSFKGETSESEPEKVAGPRRGFHSIESRPAAWARPISGFGAGRCLFRKVKWSCPPFWVSAYQRADIQWKDQDGILVVSPVAHIQAGR